MKKIVDERQELELLKIERTGFWILYIALAVDIMSKVLFLGVSPKQLIGENIAFIAGGITIIIGCTKRGLWDRYSRPCFKNYLIYSLAGSVIFTAFFGAVLLIRGVPHAITAAAIFGVSIFVILFAVLALMGMYTKKRNDKLDKEYCDD